MLYRYKPEEGRNARQAAFWLGEGLIAFGCLALRSTLESLESLRAPLSAANPEVPILGFTLNGATLIAFAAFLAATYAWVRFLSRARSADRLIEVEGELRKVTWPSFKEVSNSSAVVIGAVLVLMAFLAVSDFVLGRIFDWILWGQV